MLPLNVCAENCNRFYYDEQKPVGIIHPFAETKCFENFEAVFDSVAHINIYSAELLKGNTLNDETQTHLIIHQFDEENPIIKLYHDFPYRKQLMMPAEDIPVNGDVKDVFHYFNIVPSFNMLYARSWSMIEYHTRYLAYLNDRVYVVTGSIYSQHSRTISFHNTLIVPNAIYKAIYIPSTDKGGVYICTNNIDYICKIISLRSFFEKTRINVFPTVTQGSASRLDMKLMWYK